MTHKLENNYAKELLTLLQKLEDPQQPSHPGDPAKGLRTTKEFETIKILCASGPKRKSSDPHKRLSQTCLSESTGVYGGGVGRQQPAVGSGALKTRVLA